eukprot:scaffold38576_cov64-Phaeocystis_antarctica.AAC.2
MELSVSGCRLPSVSRDTSSDSRISGSAAKRSPFSFNSRPRLLTEQSVCGCRLPSVSRADASASRRSGSAATRSPLSLNSRPRLLMEAIVFGCRLPSVSRFTSNASRIKGSAAVRSPLASSSTPRLLMERLAEQRLSLVVLALGLQLQCELVQGEASVLPPRALSLEPRTQQLEAQRIAVVVHTLAAAVGRVLLWARAPPVLEAVCVYQLGGAAAGARLHEQAVVLAPETHPAPLLLHLRLLLLSVAFALGACVWGHVARAVVRGGCNWSRKARRTSHSTATLGDGHGARARAARATCAPASRAVAAKHLKAPLLYTRFNFGRTFYSSRSVLQRSSHRSSATFCASESAGAAFCRPPSAGAAGVDARAHPKPTRLSCLPRLKAAQAWGRPTGPRTIHKLDGGTYKPDRRRVAAVQAGLWDVQASLGRRRGRPRGG